jgi:SAM-dependent methyltransferase
MLSRLPSPCRRFLRTAWRPTALLQIGYKLVGRWEQVWQLGLSHEVSFWETWFATRGSEWPEDYAHRLDPETPLQSYVTALLDPSAKRLRLLDVGAGPLTILGKTWGDHVVEITAVDPLGAEYDRLLEKHGVTPIVRTRTAFAERLTDVFERSSFDLVHASNCLDHSVDAIAAIRQMLDVVKPGHHLVLKHAINEGRNEDYVGLHQWDFWAFNGDFMVRGRGHVTNVTDMLRGAAEVRCRIEEGFLLVTIRKLGI